MKQGTTEFTGEHIIRLSDFPSTERTGMHSFSPADADVGGPDSHVLTRGSRYTLMMSTRIIENKRSMVRRNMAAAIVG